MILLTQAEAARALRVSVSYLRERGVPQVHLPGRGGRPVVRYHLQVLDAWARQYLV